MFSKLIIVPCHSSFKAGVVIPLPCPPENEILWELMPYQKNEVKYYLEHISTGLGLLKKDDDSILIFTGGLTRKGSGRWTEARSYMYTALYNKDNACVQSRIFTEDYARDSFENILFSLCRFRQITGQYPARVSVAGWSFKKKRFDFHAKTLKYPADRFEYISVNMPEDLEHASAGEHDTLSEFSHSFYGGTGSLLQKRKARTVNMHETIPYASMPDLEFFFSFANDISNPETPYPHTLPWEFFNS